MEITKLVYDSANQQKLIKFFQEVDNLFDPPLKERIKKRSNPRFGLEDYSEKVLKHSNTFAIIVDGNIVGSIMIYDNDDVNKKSYIPLLAIKKDFQGLGYSKKLLNLAIQQASNSKMNTIYVKTWYGNKLAAKLYQSLGFSLVDNNTNDLVLVKKL
jgi:ribosomal protein S18 acetylase RimI-like enzyme